jgi:hypothetical protein
VEAFCEHGNEPLGSINAEKFSSACTTGGHVRKAQLLGVRLVNIV